MNSETENNRQLPVTDRYLLPYVAMNFNENDPRVFEDILLSVLLLFLSVIMYYINLERMQRRLQNLVKRLVRSFSQK